MTGEAQAVASLATSETGKMNSLSVGLLTAILSRAQLTPQQICALATLGRDWREACASPSVWQKLELRVPEYSLEALCCIANSCKWLKELLVVRDPTAPRALSFRYSGDWLLGVTAILEASSSSLRKVVVATGCNIYRKDYRSAPFYKQLLQRVALSARALEVCEVYCNAEEDAATTLQGWLALVASPLRQFVFWTPSADCGGVDTKCLRHIASAWRHLEVLEVSGEAIDLEGVLVLRAIAPLRCLTLNHISLGPEERADGIRCPEDVDRHYPCDQRGRRLQVVTLAHSSCDELDLLILHHQFPALEKLVVREARQPHPMDEPEGQEHVAVPAFRQAQHTDRVTRLTAFCSSHPALSSIVDFVWE